MLYPGHAAEDDYPLLEKAIGAVRLPVVITEIESDDHTVAAMRAVGTGDRLVEGARRAAAHRPDVVMWACTSGSFLYGWEGAHAQVADLATHTGVPTSSTSLAFAAACRHLGIDSVAIAATYPEPVAAGFIEFLAGAGVSTAASRAHDIMTASDAGTLDDAGLVEMVRSSDTPSSQAILVPDTALHTVAALTGLERAVGKPVLTANQVTAWHGLRLAGVDPAVGGVGSLFMATPAHR
ncbi:maleate cis-trans isomerase family protein [Gordonia soli]|uniref:Putative decarboxylase n=1 Tax=Gordonia soli NBRC 108243 TaxID=1223545 RepID=M0QFB5_9ACTN|nr:hypothetical protein [Gordonia soli]GAC67268.1 putative decarboxylase [Gordonia soli NBRC 108243]